MTLDQTVLQIGGYAFNLGQILLAGAGLALLLIIVTAILAWRGQKQRREEGVETMRRASELEFRLAEMAGQLRHFTDQAQSGQQHLARTLDERLDQVSHRVGRGLNEQAERTHASLKHLYERLAVIDTAQANLTQLSSEMVSLKDILSNKQARGDLEKLGLSADKITKRGLRI